MAKVSGRPRKKALLRASGVAALIGGAAIAAYAARTGPVLAVGAAGVMTASAAAASGLLLGFLFAIPRASASTADPPSPGPRPRFEGNTNLEQISDWLTKILVGVGLTQIDSIRSSGGALVGGLAPAFGGGPIAAAFVGALLVYFVVTGFLAGWLLTRLFLGGAMSAADEASENALIAAGDASGSALEALHAAATAAKEGDTERATQLRAVAMDFQRTAREAAERYNTLRTTQPTGWARTAELERIVARAKAEAVAPGVSQETVRETYSRGSEGDRVYALGTMQARPDLADAGLISLSIAQPGSAFEQYQALVAARAAASTLSPSARSDVAAAIRGQRGVEIRSGSDRGRLSEEVLALIETPPVD